MNLEQSLNEHIANKVNEDGRFVIDTDEKADWALRKIAEAENEIEKVEHYAESQIRQIESWRTKQTEKHHNSIEHFQSLLTEYAINKRKEDKSFKSITLPSGNIGYRRLQDKWVYNDETMIKTLESENLNDYVKVEKKLDKRELRKYIKDNCTIVDGKVIDENGQVLNGIEIKEQGETLNVRLNK